MNLCPDCGFPTDREPPYLCDDCEDARAELERDPDDTYHIPADFVGFLNLDEEN